MTSNAIPKIDEKDYHILKLLTSDVMTSFKSIAKQVGLSPPSISARIKRLRRLGVFDPTIHIEFEAIGLRTYTLGLTLRTGIPPDSRTKIIDLLMDETAVTSIWTTSGEHDLVIRVVFRSSYELMRFVDLKVRPIREIYSIDVSEILEDIKRHSKNVKSNVTKDIPVPIKRHSKNVKSNVAKDMPVPICSYRCSR